MTLMTSFPYQSQANQIEELLSDCFNIAELAVTDGLLSLKIAMQVIQSEKDPTKAFNQYMSAINGLTEYELSQIKIIPCGMPISGDCDELVRLLIHSGAKIK